MEDETASAWVESGATLGELFYTIAQNKKIHGFPAGFCPTVGVGGHFSGGGYGNMMRKYGLSTDNIIDAKLVDAAGNVLDRESMGEDLFWAIIRGGGGASFGVIVSWKIRLVLVPEIVIVFRVEKTLEQGATDIVYKWQYIADKIDQNLFIRVVLLPFSTIKMHLKSIKANSTPCFLEMLKNLSLMNERFPELGLSAEECIEMSWIESVLFWSNYPKGTSLMVLLDRQPQPEKYLKKKSDHVQQPISKENLERIWDKMIELRRPTLTLNPYGGKMSEEDGVEALNRNLDEIARLDDYMTPFVSKSPRCSYLNYRDVDIGINQSGNASYSEATIWGRKYFKRNLDRLVPVNSSSFWDSAGVRPILIIGKFVCGFHCQDPDPYCLFGISIFQTDNTFDGNSTSTLSPKIVWSVNQMYLAPNRAALKLSEEGGLMLNDYYYDYPVWNTSSAGNFVSRVNLTEEGNLVLYGRNNEIVWQSFHHPTDTLLVSGRNLTSSYSGAAFYSLALINGSLIAFLEPDTQQVYFELKTGEHRLEYINGKFGRFVLPSTSESQFIQLGSDGHLRVYQWRQLERQWNQVSDLLIRRRPSKGRIIAILGSTMEQLFLSYLWQWCVLLTYK
ncbi:hypothetical protein PTKIN_Ptkin15bG0091700 [Pterospermum kingtungense]